MITKETNTSKTFREQVEVIIRRRWYFIIPMVSIFFIAAAIGILLPKQYEAVSIIQINDKKIVEPLVAGLAISPGIKDQVEALSKQIVSWPKLYQLVKQLHLTDHIGSANGLDEYIVAFKERITISLQDQDIIEISYKDSNPFVAQHVVNRMTQNFINENVVSKKEEARNAIDFINEQLKIYRQKLESSQKNFSTHKIDSELREALSRKKLLEGQMRSMEKIVPSQVKMEQNPVVARMQSYLAELEMEYSRLMTDATEAHPRVKALRIEIDKIKKSLDAEIRKDTVRESISTVNPLYFEREQELRKVEMDVSELMKRKAELESRTDKKEKELNEEELSTLETSKKVDEDIYQMLLKQIESAYVSERLQESDKGAAFRVIEYARLPTRPVKPDRIKIMFSGLFLGIIGGLSGVFMMEYLDRSFRTADDAKRHLKMQFLGSVSKMVVENSGAISLRTRINNRIKNFMQKKKLFSDIRFISPHIARKVHNSGISPQVVIHHEPKSPISEEYRILRTNVQGLSHESSMKAVMLTSAVRGEGKSTTSMNLAVTMADSGKSTLLVDCDMRKGVVHELLNISQTPGLSDVLARGIDIDAALKESKVKNLTVLTCGNRPANPSELLGSDRMEKLIKSLKTRFDMVIMDAPPVLNLPDSCVLGKYGDGVMLVVQAERTQREDVDLAHSMLVQSHSNVVGFALTNVQYYIPKYVYDYLYGT